MSLLITLIPWMIKTISFLKSLIVNADDFTPNNTITDSVEDFRNNKKEAVMTDKKAFEVKMVEDSSILKNIITSSCEVLDGTNEDVRINKDAPISESGDVDGAKFKALRRVISEYSATSLPPIPLNNKKTAFGRIQLQKTSSLFDTLDNDLSVKAIESESPISMEAAGQVHDRAQVYVTCLSEDKRERPQYIDTIDRWSNKHVNLPSSDCASSSRLLLILVENMGRINYGQYLSDSKGILSDVYLDGNPLLKWKMLPVPLSNLNETPKINHVFNSSYSNSVSFSARKTLKSKPGVNLKEPIFYKGSSVVDKVADTYLSFNGWGKGVAFVNDFNIGRFWPSFGPQCNLYVPAPILHRGKNVLVILELESPQPELVVHSVNQQDFTCGSKHMRLRQL